MRKFNFIFTGKYLKFWYIAFIAIIGIMIWNYHTLKSVKTYTLKVYTSEGTVAAQEQIERGQIGMLLSQLPMMKSFEPNK